MANEDRRHPSAVDDDDNEDSNGTISNEVI